MIVYVALASMLLGDIADRIWRVIVQELVGYLGRRSAYEDVPSSGADERGGLETSGAAPHPCPPRTHDTLGLTALRHALDPATAAGGAVARCRQGAHGQTGSPPPHVSQ